MATKNKKLSTSTLKSIHSKNYTQKKIVISVEGQDFDVLIQEKFKMTSLQNIIMDLVEAKKQLINIDQAFDFGALVYFYIIKHMTDIEIAKSCDSFEKDVEMLNIMLDLGVVEQVFAHFDEQELKKVNECLKKMASNIKKLANDADVQKELTDLLADLKDEIPEDEEESSMQQIETVEIPVNESEESTNV